MPRKLTPLQQQIALLTAVCRADKAERKAADAPLRAQRRVLTERARKIKYWLAKAQHRRAQMLAAFWVTDERSAAFAYGSKWKNTEASIANHTADLASAEVDLALFQESHKDDLT